MQSRAIVYRVAIWLYSVEIMDGQSREIAAALVDLYHAEMSPQFEGLREQLAGRLAVSQQTVESLRQQEAERRANYDLLRGFTALLPATPEDPDSGAWGDELLVDNAHEARQAQAHVLWLREPYGYSDKTGHFTPYYIVGRCAAEGVDDTDMDDNDSPATHLLLSSAQRGNTANALQMVTVNDNELKIAETAVQTASYRDIDPEEIQRMFSRSTGMLRVSRAGGMRTRLVDRHRLAEVSRWRDVAKQVDRHGMHVRARGSYDMRIEDAELEAFNVFNVLGELATAFGKKDELLALLANYDKTPAAETQE